MMDHTREVNSVSFSPDGARIVSGSGDKTVRVWDAVSGECVLGPLAGHTSYVMSVSFSPDGTRIVSGSADTTVRVWDAVSGECVLGPLAGHTEIVMSVSWNPAGNRIVSAGSVDLSVRVWDAVSGQCVLGPLMGHISYVTSVSFSPDGTRIVSGSRDSTVRVWDAVSGQCVLGPIRGHMGWVTSVSWNPAGDRIVSGSANTVRVWDAVSGQCVLGPLEGHKQNLSSVSFSPDGTRIVSGSDDKTVRVWDAESGKCVLLIGTPWINRWTESVDYDRKGVPGPLEGHTKSVTSVSWDPAGNRIVSGSDDGTVRMWDIIMMEFYSLRQEILDFINFKWVKTKPTRANIRARMGFLIRAYLPRMDALVDRARAAGTATQSLLDAEVGKFHTYIDRVISQMGITTSGDSEDEEEYVADETNTLTFYSIRLRL